jgi:hypothetical protein
MSAIVAADRGWRARSQRFDELREKGTPVGSAMNVVPKIE